VRSWEPALDADIRQLLGVEKPVRFTRDREEVEVFLAERLPEGAWEAWSEPAIDARVRHSAEDAWRHACENRTMPRDNEATALTLAYLRGCALAFSERVACRPPSTAVEQIKSGAQIGAN
jgi:hypothetical protein